MNFDGDYVPMDHPEDEEEEEPIEEEEPMEEEEEEPMEEEEEDPMEEDEPMEEEEPVEEEAVPMEIEGLVEVEEWNFAEEKEAPPVTPPTSDDDSYQDKGKGIMVEGCSRDMKIVWRRQKEVRRLQRMLMEDQRQARERILTIEDELKIARNEAENACENLQRAMQYMKITDGMMGDTINYMGRKRRRAIRTFPKPIKLKK